VRFLLALPDLRKIKVPKDGRRHRLRRALQLATSLLLLAAPFLGLLRVDLLDRKLVVFGARFAFSEFAILYAVLIVSMFVLFMGALIHGRLWCGWMCPQTTLSELTGFFQRKFLKGRTPKNSGKLLAHAATIAVAMLVAASLVSYFLAPSQYSSPPLAAWVLWGIASTLLSADLLVVRHRFCVGICPYGILQGVVQDPNTLGVVFDLQRANACIDCSACVRSCPTGFDIRGGSFDMKCISCGDCADSCDKVLNAKGVEGLIAFRFGQPTQTKRSFLARLGIIDGKRLLTVAVASIAITVVVGLFLTRAPISIKIASQFEQTESSADGLVTNHYSLSIRSHLEHAVSFEVEASGLDGLEVLAPVGPVSIAAGADAKFELLLRAPHGPVGGADIQVTVHVEEQGDFVVPVKFFFPSAPTESAESVGNQATFPPEQGRT